VSIQYAGGTIVNTLWTATTGTRTELADQIATQLVAAGWSSTGASGDHTLTSATTPAGFLCRVRSYDSGAGNCARLKMSDSGGVHTQSGDLFLLPAAAKQWRIICNQYQFWVYVPGTGNAREFAAGGVLYIPSFVTQQTELWGVSNSQSDTDATARVSLRTQLTCVGNTGTSVNVPNQYMLSGAVATEESNAGSVSTRNGDFQLVGAASLNGTGNSTATTSINAWSTGDFLVSDALVAWGASTTAQPKIHGQLWDAFLTTGAFSTDQSITFDGHSWLAITTNNPNWSASSQPGTLFIATT
jgi:hypothetical protein